MSKRVAIIGGGCASMTAAWELTQPHLKDQFEVTVYQQGWRLGGKGASGRDAKGRIEEHGLHLWLGHYDNAFALMKEVYAELDRDPETCPVATWRDAFEPANWVGLTDPDDQGEWRQFLAHFPPQPGEPGDPRAGDLVTFTDFLRQTTNLVLALIQGAAGIEAKPSNGSELNPGRGLELVKEVLAYGQIASLTALQHALLVLDLVLSRSPFLPRTLYAEFIEAIVRATRRLIEPLLQTNTTARYTWEIIDIVLACFRGSAHHDLINDPRGFDAIDDYDIRDWLVLHGASERSVESAFVRGLYDLAFAYDNGVPNGAKLAAGQGLRGGMRMFFYYREAIFWKMTAGMGDIVFAPMYEALVKRGVRFEFFHRLENVGIDTGDTPHVTTLEFDVQAEATDDYYPLVDVKGLPCWPSQPNWAQLKNSKNLQTQSLDFESFWNVEYVNKKTLKVQTDFDFVVLGLSVGAIPHTCPEILDHNAKWRTMIEHVRTVPTQALQLWMNKDLSELGWHHPSANVSGFVEPFDTWADMTHLLPLEDWDHEPRSLAYFCNVLPAPDVSEYDRTDESFPQRFRTEVLENSRTFLKEHMRHLWPEAFDPEQDDFKWHWLHAESEEHLDALATQFWTANINPTDRYVLCPPGSIQHRLSPLDNTYDNLTVTGDWTSCGLNLGCVESAVMSGRLASHALSLSPRLEDISGYDHV